MKIKKERFKEILKKRKLTIRELAEKLGKSYRSIFTWIDGTRSPSASDIKIIAQILGVKPSEICEGAKELDDKSVILQGKNPSDLDFINKKFSSKLNIEQKTYLMQLKNDIELLSSDIKNLQLENQRQQLILESLDEMVYMKDSKLRFIYANSAFKSYFDLTEESLISKHGCSIFSEAVYKEFDRIESQIFTTGNIVLKTQISLTDKADRKRYAHLSIRPVFNQDGKVTNIIGTINDTTAFIETEKRMSLVEEAINGLNESIWVAYTKPLEIIFISENTARLSGRMPDEFYSKDIFLNEVLHPDDKERFLQEFNNIPKPCKIKHRELHKDGSIIKVETEIYQGESPKSSRQMYYGITRKL